MLNFDAGSVADALPYSQLADALDEAFRSDAHVPERVHHTVDLQDGTPATLLLMPAWRAGEVIGVKIANIFPDNAERGLPAVNAIYVVMDGVTGELLALLDGAELTLRRTAAASAMASRYLSHPDATTMLMVGTGKLAPHLIQAHAETRNIETVEIWGRRPEAAAGIVEHFADRPWRVAATDDLESAVRKADIISCATLSTEPLVRGAWLRQGQHLDLVGAFTGAMRESDAEALRRSRVYVDTFAGVMSEGGDVLQAIAEGGIAESDIVADLRGLARGDDPGRRSPEEITLFKSVGYALEDLVAAQLVVSGRGMS